MKWLRQWQQRRTERQIVKALVALSIAQTRLEGNYLCVECNGHCDVCERDCQDCD